MKRKVLFITPSLSGGGAERVIVNLLRNIDRSKFEIFFISINLSGPYVKNLPSDINVIDLKKTRVRYSFFKLIKAINTIMPDVILTTLGFLNLMLIVIKPFLKSKPKVIVREANTVSKEINDLSCTKRFFYKSLYRFLYPRADLIIAQSIGMKDDLIKNISLPLKKIKIVYNPVDINYVLSKSQEANPFSDEKYIRIVSVGRLSYQKGFDILLEAIKILVKFFPNIRLYILGEGPLRDQLISMANDLKIENNVFFIGFVENPYIYIKNSDVFVLPSRWEGFPNVLLEALACNAKIVSTNCKSGPSEILGNEEYGLLADVENAGSLAEKIHLVLNNLLSIKSPLEKAWKYDVSYIVKQYEEILMEL